MRDSIRRVDSYSVEVPDQPGEAYRTLSKLGAMGINLTYFTAYHVGGGKALLDLVVEDRDLLLRTVKEGQIPSGTWTPAFMVSGPDRVGRASEVLEHLADAKINAHAASGTTHGGAYGMILWVRPEDAEAAAEALRT
jgi:hypothetical protein